MSEISTDKPTIKTKVEPTLKLKFLSHGTLESIDLEFTRRFYEEFLGLEVIKVSNVSLWCRLGGNHIMGVGVVKPERKLPMPFLYHNGLDVETEEDVDECHKLVVRDAEKWKLQKTSKPGVQPGTYSFFFVFSERNYWEILANPPGGYSWMFERGDQQGIGHMSRGFERPASTLRKRPKDA